MIICFHFNWKMIRKNTQSSICLCYCKLIVMGIMFQAQWNCCFHSHQWHAICQIQCSPPCFLILSLSSTVTIFSMEYFPWLLKHSSSLAPPQSAGGSFPSVLPFECWFSPGFHLLPLSLLSLCVSTTLTTIGSCGDEAPGLGRGAR